MTTPSEFPEQRYDEPVRYYEGNGIVVYWEPRLCIHTENCISRLSGVFRPNERPWIDATAAGADVVAETVRTCPSGALGYQRTDGGPQESGPEEIDVTPLPDGPLYLHGNFDLIDAEGKRLRHGHRVALCRCGGSENKPFCDNSHRRIDFRA